MRHHPGVSLLRPSIDHPRQSLRVTRHSSSGCSWERCSGRPARGAGSGRRARAAQVGRRWAGCCGVIGRVSVPGRGAQALRLPPEQTCCMAGDGQGQEFHGNVPVQHGSGGRQKAVLISHGVTSFNRYRGKTRAPRRSKRSRGRAAERHKPAGPVPPGTTSGRRRP